MAVPINNNNATTEAMDITLNELGQDLDTALDFVTAEFEGQRARAQRYYNGQSDLLTDANRSKYVATKVRDIIRSVRPSLMRIFMATPNPVEFVPQTVAQSMIAEKQTNWINQLFYDLGGYNTIYDAFHSAMLFKLGVVKYWYDEKADPIYRSYTGLSEQQVMALTSHPMVEVLKAEELQMIGPQGMVMTFNVDIVGQKMAGDVKMKWVPLTEFLVDRNATCKEDARVMAHRRNVTRSECVAMGFDPEDLEGLNSDNTEVSRYASESFARRGYTVFPSDDDTRDESMQDVLLTEAYYRADLDGTGMAQLYRFWLGGTDYKLLDYERIDEVPFALFSIDPEPGTLFGKSLYDLVESEQDAITSITRATVDNFHMTNNPRLAVHEHMVNMDDVLNNDLGSPIRVRSAGQIQPITVPFTGGAALPLLQFLDADVENKTGVTKAAQGLDPDAMQSTDKNAVMNTIQLAQGQVELMARNLAETGMKDLAMGLLKLAMAHLDSNQILRTDGQNTPINIDVFDPTMKSRAAVGIGTGNHDEKMMALNEVYAVQKEILGQYGAGNPIVSLMQMQNTMNDKLKMSGINNPARYFNQVTPQQEQQLAQQQQQQAQQQSQTQMQIAQQQSQALAQAEQVKAQAALQIAQGKGQIDIAKLQEKAQIDRANLIQKESSDFSELLVKDDLERDKMLQQMWLKIIELEANAAQGQMIEHKQAVN